MDGKVTDPPWEMDPPQRVTAHEGCKQVFLDGEHFADAVSPEAAQIIAICLNNSGLAGNTWTRAERERVADFFA